VKTKPWHQHFETVGSIMAIVVGIAALYMSWDQGRVMRTEIAASIWPALQMDGFVSREGEALTLGLRVSNAGVGPALVKGMTVRYDGETLHSMDDISRALPEGASQRGYHTVNGRILAAGASIEPFTFALPASETLDAVTLSTALSEHWTAEICYCSSLDDCWTSSTESSTPQAVEHCPVAGSSL
jgi:hypothetical protein